MGKNKSSGRKILRTIGGMIKTIGVLLLIAIFLASNLVLPRFSRMFNEILTYKQTYNTPSAMGLDLEYNKPDFTKDELKTVGQNLNEEIAGEGIVLLQNDGIMPFAEGTKFSFFSHSSVDTLVGGYLGGSLTLKDAFESRGFAVNEKLWNFYKKDAKDYKRGPGSISYGRSEDFSINECPVSEIENAGIEDSLAGTTGVFVWSRVVGEGRDMPRSMYSHTDIAEDKVKSYLEPDSVELGVLSYMNEHFDNIVLLVNSPSAMELGWVEDFENIRAVVLMGLPGTYGLNAVADIFAGNINPSGHLADTMAYDAFSSPAAQNYGDFQYVDENGELTKYSYLSYEEGIYVGYKYYETRYEDVVLKQGNAGAYDYASVVQYPFGYGLSYTTFGWDHFNVSWEGDVCTVSVEVTNTGDVAGKEVVQIYAQSPYTEYDRNNGIEKASVQLAAYGKTQLLQPGEKETVMVTFTEEQLKSYDAKGAGTYILDAGDYYITAASDAHCAVNNILAAKEKTVSDGMTENGDEAFVEIYTPDNADTDTVTYAKDTYSDADIVNQFEAVDGGLAYLSRNDWEGTWPQNDGTVSEYVSTWGNEINGTDADGNPVPFVYVKTATEEEIAQMDSNDSLNPIDDGNITDAVVFGEDNGLTLIEMRGLEYDDPEWERLLNQLTEEDYNTLVNESGYGTPAIGSIQKPYALDADSATGLVFGDVAGLTFNGAEMLAQTFNHELAERFGNFLGNDAYYGNITGWYCPAMNIHRTPFSGRNNEYYSEDGYLSGIVASEAMRAAAEKGMYTFIKHFALNDQENHRGDTETEYGVCTWANEQSIRELYLLPFEMCMKAGDVELNYVKSDRNGGYTNEMTQIRACQAMMTAFNRLGCTWTGGHYNLITGVVRNEWAFNGFIITDADTPTHMDPMQMIKAGADGKLNYSMPYTLDWSDPVVYHYSREAAHHILYTVANSKIMIGAMPGSTLTGIPTAILLRIALSAISGIPLLIIIVRTVLKWKKKRTDK